MIACEPSYGYGVHFSQPSSGELPPGTEGVVQQYRGSRYPDGSWIGYASTAGAAVWVVTDDRTSTRQVLDSATPVGAVDANGCPPRQHQEVPVRDQVVVCRYEEDATGAERGVECRGLTLGRGCPAIRADRPPPR